MLFHCGDHGIDLHRGGHPDYDLDQWPQQLVQRLKVFGTMLFSHSVEQLGGESSTGMGGEHLPETDLLQPGYERPARRMCESANPRLCD